MRGAVFLAILLALAGCNGLVGEPPRTETVTPAPVPTESPYPPGVTADGVADAVALAEVHARRLNGTSFTVLSNRTVRSANGTLRSRFRMRLALAADRSFYARVAVRGPDAPVVIGEPPTRAEYWSDGETYLRRQEIFNRTEYSSYGPGDSYVGTWRFWLGSVALDIGPRNDAREAFGSFRTSVAGRTTVDGERRIRLVGTSTTDEAFAEDRPGRSIRNATLRASVADSGLIRRYTVTYTADAADGATVRVRRTVRYRAVGNTSVERPSWADRAVEEG